MERVQRKFCCVTGVVLRSCREEGGIKRPLQSQERGRGSGRRRREGDCNFTRPGNCAASLFGMHEAAVSNGRRRVSVRRDFASTTPHVFSIRIPRSCETYTVVPGLFVIIGKSGNDRTAITTYTCSYHRSSSFFRSNEFDENINRT